MKKTIFLLAILLLTFAEAAKAQSKFYLTSGLFYNGTTLAEHVGGGGVILGVEYMKHPEHFFNIGLRTKYGYYRFDDGTTPRENADGTLSPPVNPDKARLEYSLFTPQLSIVPKFYLHWDESFSLFLENEFSAGLMSGRFSYRDIPGKINITEPILSYTVGLGVEFEMGKFLFSGLVGYSTLNFRSKIEKHRPVIYEGKVPNQHAGLFISMIFKVPLGKNR